MSPVLKKTSVVYLLCIQILVVLTVTHISMSFNLDLETPMILQPPDQRKIQFGFSLAHILNGTERRLLVGAPTANTTQTDVVSPGALYSCSLDTSSASCFQMTVDTRNKGDKYQSWITEDHKDNQRLGYTIAADGKNIVVCAPGWHIFDNVAGRLKDLPMGICFKANNTFKTFEPFSPPYLAAIGYHKSAATVTFQNNGSCQIGMSISASKDAGVIDFGSPGCWNWLGDTWSISMKDVEDYKNYQRATVLSFSDVDLTYNSDLASDDTLYNSLADLYLGYSVASMTYEGVTTTVSAMPRICSAAELRVNERNLVVGPVVYIFYKNTDTNKLVIRDKIKPPMNKTQQKETSLNNMFSYFGYSLATADVNGDGLDDIIIGAPFYHNDTHYDQGAIFVYTQIKFEQQGDEPPGYEMKAETNAPERIGKESYGRFGSCVAAIGDIDTDGYEDIAVGAPFLDGGGAVFIYFGSKTGLETTYRQMIKASSLPSTIQPVSGFGYSIAQRLPAQSKQRYEVAIGAFDSDVVAVFKAKEVMFLDCNITFNEKMDLSKKKCVFNDINPGVYPCVTSEVCLVYKKSSATNSKQSLRFLLKLQADKRLFFENEASEFEKQLLLEDVMKCESITIYAKEDMDDVITSFKITYLVEYQKQNLDQVVLDPRTELFTTETLEILVQCEGKEAGQCMSDLRLEYQLLRNYTLMADRAVLVNFMVENRGETAYNTRLLISSQGDLSLSNTNSSDVTCEDNIKFGRIECQIGQLYINNTVEFNLSMTPTANFFTKLQTHNDSFQVNASLSTSSQIINHNETDTLFNIPISVDVQLDLTKDQSSPASVYYNDSEYFKSPSVAKGEEELGPQISHTYKIFNNHNHDIYKTKVTIMWPLKIDGKYLLYLLDMPAVTGMKPVCNYSGGEVNEFHIKPLEETLKSENQFNKDPSLQEVKLQSMTFASAGIGEKKIQYLKFQCTFGTLSNREQFEIKFRSRLVQRTITQLEIGGSLTNVSSWAQLQVLQLPLGAPLPPPTNPSQINTVISYKFLAPLKIAWWIYLLASLGGILVLAIICIILWKCGFFNRKKPQDVADATDGEDKEEGEEAAEGEEGENEDDPVTPTSPMLKETERANDDFEFSTSMNNDVP